MKSASAFPRSAGILLHPTSLPGPFGVGDFGAGARMFVDWLAAARLSLWQVLPLGPAGPGGSPYSSPSAFALHPGLLDLEELHGRGLLDADDIAAPDLPVDFADLPRALAFKRTRAEKAAQAFLHSEPGRVAMRIFRTSEPWVEEFALFSVLCRANDERAWWTWDGPLALRNPEALTDAARTHAAAIEVEVAIQTLLDEQWHAADGDPPGCSESWSTATGGCLRVRGLRRSTRRLRSRSGRALQ